MSTTVAGWLASLADWEPTPEAVAAGQRIADLFVVAAGGDHRAA